MNVLEVIVDQHQAALMGCAGHPQAITPNIDRLAAEGVRFESAYTQNPICTPSRVSVLSGQYCHNHGFYGLSGRRPEMLPSFMSHFKSQGYVTAGIGNLHTPDDPANWLEDHLDLFSDTFTLVEGNSEKTEWCDEVAKAGLSEIEDFAFAAAHPEYFLEGMPSKIPYEMSQEGWSVRRAIRFMEERKSVPFCMQVSLARPHQPFFPSSQFWDMYPDDIGLPASIDQDPSRRPPHFRQMFDAYRSATWAIEPKTFEAGARRVWRGYLGCITQVDFSLGLLLDYLDESGLAEDTVVVYHADHGGYSGTCGIHEKAPGICSEAVCRIPFIWRVPGTSAGAGARGLVQRSFVENVDIAPTLAGLCGLPEMDTVDGRDISALLHGDTKPVREMAVTELPWSKGIRWDTWRFVHYQREMFGEDLGELYDIENDPQESNNLYGDPDFGLIVEESRRRLLEWLIGTTRHKTVWPAIDWSSRPYDYQTAGDGKESNTAGPAARWARGEYNYL